MLGAVGRDSTHSPCCMEVVLHVNRSLGGNRAVLDKQNENRDRLRTAKCVAQPAGSNQKVGDGCSPELIGLANLDLIVEWLIEFQ